MKHQLIHKSTLKPAVWDGGETFEYFIFPENSVYSQRNFLFRISSASIHKIPSDFTRFNAYKRFLVMLDNPLKINRNGKDENYRKNEVFTFNSSDKIISYSTGNDFNLMVSEEINFSEVKITNALSEIHHDFVCCFALENCSIRFNEKELSLQTSDLLLIQNSEKSLIDLKSDKNLIIGVIALD